LTRRQNKAPAFRPIIASRRVFRFAPSPNGLLHLGHAYSALMNQRLMQASGGTMLLRLENIDAARCLPAFEVAIEEDLAWLGIEWQPPVCRQSERFPLYRATLDTLDAMGLLYPCFCTRSDIARAISAKADWPRDPDGSPLYPGTCRDRDDRDRLLAAGVPAGVRLDMRKALDLRRSRLTWTEWREGNQPRPVPANPAAWGDILLARKDIPTSYHVAVVTDDAAQGVTDVVRGEDLFHATGLHRLLQTLLNYPEPAYHHHSLILDPSGEKLSKSRNAPTLQALRQSGEQAGDVRRQLGFA
jgi:glutamyl-Q tRNA(Asp) synthetase